MTINDFKVGFFLVVRYIRSSSIWTTSLIILVMVITFLNILVIGGLLEGIIVGSIEGLRNKALGDVYLSTKENKDVIERTQQIISKLESSGLVESYSARHSAGIEIIAEADLRSVVNENEKRKTVSTAVLGVDPQAEKETTRFDKSVLEGSYFSPKSKKEILIGSGLIKRYSPFGDRVLGDIHPGDYVYIRLSGSSALNQVSAEGPLDKVSDEDNSGILQKYLVKGIFRTKAGELDLVAVVNSDDIRSSLGKSSNNVNSIAIKLFNQTDEIALKNLLKESNFDKYAKIETVEEALGSYLDDIRTIFALLGSIVGAIGLIVASIIIFIIIFVTAYANRKQIGILKAIGIAPSAIKISYILFALFFAIVGISIGSLIMFGLLVPYFAANPLDFPFSDGILYLPGDRILFQIGLILLATFIAGFIPSRNIVNRPAIDAVRGR